MFVRVDDEHQTEFADVHIKGLRREIAEELSVSSYIDAKSEERLQELKTIVGVPAFKFLTSSNNFKLTYSQCSKFKEQLDSIYIHRSIYEEEYNSLLQMLKDLLEEAYNQQQSIEFII